MELSDVPRRHLTLHDLSCARDLGVTAALNWAAAELGLPALADAGYDGAGHGIKTPARQPADGKPLAVANRTVNRLLRGPRWQGERGFAMLTGRWRTLRHSTISPTRIGDVIAAASTSHTSNIDTYPKVAEITSVSCHRALVILLTRRS